MMCRNLMIEDCHVLSGPQCNVTKMYYPLLLLLFVSYWNRRWNFFWWLSVILFLLQWSVIYSFLSCSSFILTEIVSDCLHFLLLSLVVLWFIDLSSSVVIKSAFPHHKPSMFCLILFLIQTHVNIICSDILQVRS